LVSHPKGRTLKVFEKRMLRKSFISWKGRMYQETDITAKKEFHDLNLPVSIIGMIK
jgi:hypothetical protein